jgi:chloride channel 3/4/5
MSEDREHLVDISDEIDTDLDLENDPELNAAAQSYAMHSLNRGATHGHDDDDTPLASRSDGVFSSPSPSRSETPMIQTKMSKKNYDDFSTIDWARDAANDWARAKALKSKSNRYSISESKRDRWFARYAPAWDASQGWIVVSLIGCFAGVLAGILNVSISWLNDIKLGACTRAFWLSKKQCCWAEEYLGEPDCDSWSSWSDMFGISGSGGTYVFNYFMYLVMAAVFSLTSAFLVKRLAPYAAGSGLAEIKVILGGFIIRGYFGFWTLVVKTAGIVLALASGLNLGNEGPMVHISLCLGNVFTRIFKKFNTNEAKRREMLSAAAAIGVAAAFNAPIGGVLYSLEEVSYYFPHKTMWRSFFGCLVAALTLSYMNPLSYREGTFNDRDWQWFEVPAMLFLGAFGVCFLLHNSFLMFSGSFWSRFLSL